MTVLHEKFCIILEDFQFIDKREYSSYNVCALCVRALLYKQPPTAEFRSVRKKRSRFSFISLIYRFRYLDIRIREYIT